MRVPPHLLVKLDDEAQMVVDVRHAGLCVRALSGPNEAERVAAVVHRDGLAVGHLADHLRCRRQVVHDQMDTVVLLDALGEQCGALLGELGAAEHLEVRFRHLHVIRRILDHGAVQHLAEVLDSISDLRRLAERQAVVVVGLQAAAARAQERVSRCSASGGAGMRRAHAREPTVAEAAAGQRGAVACAPAASWCS